MIFGNSKTNEHGCVPFVVIAIRSFPHSWLITGFVKKHDGATSRGDTIAASLAYGVYISQLIRYSKACVKYSDFLTQKQRYSNKATLLLG